MPELRVLVNAYFPPRTGHLAGGAQQVVHDLLSGLADRAVRVEVICPEVEDDDCLLAHENLQIRPVLIEPGSGTLTPYERQLNLQHLAAAVDRTDVVLTVDRAFPLQVDQPVLLLLNNFSYGTEVDSVFSFTWDSVTVASPYLAEVVAAIAGPELWHGDERPIRVASPGIDQAHFRPSSPAEARAWLGVGAGRYLVFPHRPDPDKGFDVALDVLRRLRQQGENVRLLVPTPPKSVRAVRSRERRFIERLQSQMTHMELTDAVVLHPWVPHHLLPSYYSLAECCLVPSRLPEGFGLSVVQSISCGTPVVATPAGAIPGLLPSDHGVTVVPFDDGDAAAAATVSAMGSSPDAVTRGIEFIGHRYRVDRYVETLIDHLLSATKSDARYAPRAPRPTTPAPWWREAGSHAPWHDYLMKHMEAAPVEDSAGPGRVNATDLSRGLYVGQVDDAPHEEGVRS